MTLVPYLHGSEEHKTKPTQHSVKELQGMGISPDIIVLRCDEPLEESIFRKISLFCNVKPDCVIENMTLPVLYEAPIMLERNRFSEIVCRELHIDAPAPDMTEWDAMLESIRSRSRRVTIGLVGNTSSCTTHICPWPRHCATPDTSMARVSTFNGLTARRSRAIM